MNQLRHQLGMNQLVQTFLLRKDLPPKVLHEHVAYIGMIHLGDMLI